jgi:2-polyprenyl-6-hydroxyphenyl methylase / 3-demethylubiquinone-9 3-methyltransferase
MATHSSSSGLSSLNPEEVARFNALAKMWWNPSGPMGVLHKFNPPRLDYIARTLATHFQRDRDAPLPLQGLSLLDIGCGGGLVSEPMARLGATVTGIDPAQKNILIAQDHAHSMGLGINYRAVTVETMVQEGQTFDVVLALEVIEHVAHPETFVATCARALKPGGVIIMATLNRTLASFALAIVGAEYVLRWLPRGTHSWNAFVRPSEMKDWMEQAGVIPFDESGVAYNPIKDIWKLTPDMRVNYMISALKKSI